MSFGFRVWLVFRGSRSWGVSFSCYVQLGAQEFGFVGLGFGGLRTFGSKAINPLNFGPKP